MKTVPEDYGSLRGLMTLRPFRITAICPQCRKEVVFPIPTTLTCNGPMTRDEMAARLSALEAENKRLRELQALYWCTKRGQKTCGG